MKAFFEFVAMFSMGRILDLVYGLIKGHCVRIYVNLIESIRSVYVIIFLTLGFLFLFIGGFSLLHVALFLSLPWELSSKVILLLCLGFFYCAFSLIMVSLLLSKKQWLKMSKAQTILDDHVTKKADS